MAARSRTPFLRSLLLAALLAFAGFAAPSAHGGETYYVLMFGQQRIPNSPNYSHTFAVFVKACWAGEGPCPAGAAAIESRTVSWLPATMTVRIRALSPEPGRNFDYPCTLRWAAGNDMRTSMWGPYQVKPDLYDRALRQAALLESGRVEYKASDMGHRNDRVSNCIHAVDGVIERGRLRMASPGWGEVASHFVLERMEPWILDQEHPHAWVGSALGLDAYPIIYRDYGHPHSGAIRGPVYRLFGGERDLQPTYGPPQR